MSHPPSPEPLFLTSEAAPVFVTLHRADGSGRDTAVLLCPPFGWEEICSYRMLRHWAQDLARAGYPALRVTLPGTGDSGGSPRDHELLKAWVEAVAHAAGWVRQATGAERVATIGIGLGGLVAALAAGEGAEIDDLVLWATPARGRALIRQLKTFARFERSLFYEGRERAAPPAGADELEAGGFVLSAETVAALDAVDLAVLELPEHPARDRRALLLERDGMAVDEALRVRLESLGVAVTVMPGQGFADMTAGPQTSRVPVDVVQRVRAWLDGGSGLAGTGSGTESGVRLGAESGASGASPTAEMTVDGRGSIRETVLTIPQPFGRLAAVLSEPVQPPRAELCVILLNAGAVRRVGPSRLWVEAARRWASEGVPVVRLDVEAVGDADGDETPYRRDAALYEPWFVPQVVATMDFLQERGVAASFVLGGLCSGAYWAFNGALQDRRVSGVMMMNPRVLVWSPALGPRRDLRKLLTGRPSLAMLRRAGTGARVSALLRWLAQTPVRVLRRLWTRESPELVTGQRIDTELADMMRSGRRVLLLFSDGEPLHDELKRTGRMERLAAAPNVVIEHVPVRDHTVRPVWAQRLLHQALDRALAREPAVMALRASSPAPAGSD